MISVCHICTTQNGNNVAINVEAHIPSLCIFGLPKKSAPHLTTVAFDLKAIQFQQLQKSHQAVGGLLHHSVRLDGGYLRSCAKAVAMPRKTRRSAQALECGQRPRTTFEVAKIG